MSIEKLLNFLSREARPVILDWYKEDTCILSTAIAVDFCRHFGEAITPLTCRADVYNEQMRKMIEQKKSFPTEEQVEKWCKNSGAWGIGIGYPKKDPIEQESSKWPGHLVAYTNEYLLDLSIDQATRPAKKMFFKPLLTKFEETKVEEFLLGKWFCVIVGGNVIIYHAFPEDCSYTGSRDWWNPAKRKAIVDYLIDKYEKGLHGKP